MRLANICLFGRVCPMLLSETLKWLFLDLNSFFASCEQQENPSLRGKPVGVVPMFVDTTCCLAASYEAKAFGVKTGTSVGDAKKMCPGIQFVKARHETYVKYHHAVLEAAEKCWPVTKVMSIDEIACELTGSHTDPLKAIALSKLMKKKIRDHVGVSLTSSIGLATNPFLAKVASDMQKPDGLTILYKSELPYSLYKLKLTDFPGIGKNMEKRLLTSGVDSVHKLLGLSKNEMRAIWGGVNGEYFYTWLRGEETAGREIHTRSLGHQHVLPPDLRSRHGARAIWKRLLAKLAVRLRKDGYYARKLTVECKFISPPMKWGEYKNFQETQDTFFFYEVMEEMLKKWPKGVPLRVGVTLSDLVPFEKHQLSFEEEPEQEKLILALDKINSKYGRDTLYFGAYHGLRKDSESKIAFSRIPDLDEF